MSPRSRFLVLMCLISCGLAVSVGTRGQEVAAHPQIPADLPLVSTWSQIVQLTPLERTPQWVPQTNKDRTRGAAAFLYDKIAPATVVVRTGNGHGTGFIIDPEGWILTNHHVIAEAQVDSEMGAQQADIHLGTLEDGSMRIVETALPAVVYKASEQKDLALLKLRRLPPGVEKLPSIALASDHATPGSTCVAIGHPAAGMLWTVREGIISATGIWPMDMIDVLMERLALTGNDRQRLEAACDKADKRKVVISTCGLNPGDSGGPLVNERGELVAVSFAIPGNAGNIALAKFSYHVDLEEVREFLKDRPEVPQLYVPSPWPAATRIRLMDLDADRTPDTLAFSADMSDEVTGLVFDLDQDSKPSVENGEFDKDTWDFECALQFGQPQRTFCDRDDDGTIDTVLIDQDGDGNVDQLLERADDVWRVAASGNEQLSVTAPPFRDRAMAKRLQELLTALDKMKKGAPDKSSLNRIRGVDGR